MKKNTQKWAVALVALAGATQVNAGLSNLAADIAQQDQTETAAVPLHGPGIFPRSDDTRFDRGCKKLASLVDTAERKLFKLQAHSHELLERAQHIAATTHSCSLELLAELAEHDELAAMADETKKSSVLAACAYARSGLTSAAQKMFTYAIAAKEATEKHTHYIAPLVTKIKTGLQNFNNPDYLAAITFNVPEAKGTELITAYSSWVAALKTAKVETAKYITTSKDAMKKRTHDTFCTVAHKVGPKLESAGLTIALFGKQLKQQQ